MRIPLVPLATVFTGAALFAAPFFVPLCVERSTLGDGLDARSAVQPVWNGITFAALVIVFAGIILLHRRHLLRHDRHARRVEIRICTGLATGLIAAALFSAAAVAVLVDGMAIKIALHADNARTWLAGVLAAFTGLILVACGLARRQPVQGGRREPQEIVPALLAITLLVTMAAAPAHAISLGEMAEEAGEDLELLPFFISVIFYILGLVIAGFGLLRLKRHVDHPSQTTLASGIVALAIAAALIATPSLIDAIGETFDIDSGATLERPDFD